MATLPSGPASEQEWERQMAEERVTVMGFLNEHFIRDMDAMVKCGLSYYAFALLCHGIEVMGAVFDTSPWECYGQSKTRFNSAIDELFDGRYRAVKGQLYASLRSYMTHQLRIGPQFNLALDPPSPDDRSRHLTRDNDGTYEMVIGVFLEDFKCALRKLNARVEKGDASINRLKIQDVFFFLTSSRDGAS